MKVQYDNVAMERNQAHTKSAETQKLIDDVQRDLLKVTK